MSETTTPKVLEYPNFHGMGTSRLVYVILPDRRCVFSGVTRRGTSTVNRAETIIDLIAQREEVDPFAYRWFDLQTHLQYGGTSYCPHPGEFEYDELTLCVNDQRTTDRHIVIGEVMEVSVSGFPEPYKVEQWRPTPCPPEVVALFREYIGDVSRPAYQCQTPVASDPNRPHGFRSEIRDMDEGLLPLFDTIEQLGRELRPDLKEFNPRVRPEFEQAWDQMRACLLKGQRVHAQTLVSLEMLMQGLRRWDDVEFLQRHMLRMMPGDIETLGALGSTMFFTGRYIEAEECFTQAIESQRKLLRQRNCNLDGLLTQQLEIAEQNAADVRTFVADAAIYYRRLAEAQIRRGRYEEAIESARNASHLYAVAGFKYSDPWRLMGEAQLRLGNGAEGRVLLEHCLQVHTVNPKHDFGANPNRVARVLRILRRGHRNVVPFLDFLNKQELEE